MSTEKEAIILFNQECGICNTEIKYYKKKSDLNFVNCSEMGDKYLKQLHVRLPNDKELVGVDAFIYVWSYTNGFNILAKIVKLPLIYNVAKIVYKIIAFLLFYRFKMKKYLFS